LQKNTECIFFKHRRMKDRIRINFRSAEFKQMTKENRLKRVFRELRFRENRYYLNSGTLMPNGRKCQVSLSREENSWTSVE